MKYQYELLNYWNDSDDLYVNYIVEDLESHKKANVINYFNTSDIGCNYNTASIEVIESSLYKLIKKNNGVEFNMPKVSELSPLLKYVYDCVCNSESNMCHIDYNEWEELKDYNDFIEEDIATLKKEIDKCNLDDYITIDDGEYKICGYGGLQCCFNDDRDKGSDELER